MNPVDEDQAVLGRDELEVDGMHERPDLPRSLASTKKVLPDLVSNSSPGVTIDQTKVGEEDSHEDGARKLQKENW